MREYTEEQVRNILSNKIEAIGGLRKFTAYHGLNVADVSRTMNMRRPTPKKVLDALGLRRAIVDARKHA